jgi:predicted MPP superfamily phosphohydrolase
MQFPWKTGSDWLRTRPPGGAAVEDLADFVVRSFALPGAPASLVGQRLLLFSDLHWSKGSDSAAVALVQAVNGLEADWLLFAGDLIRYLEFWEPAAGILNRLRARRGKAAVPGNRERVHGWLSCERWQQLFAETGFRLLLNSVWRPQQSPGLLLAGLDDGRRGTPDLTSLRQADCATADLRVLLSHTPDSVARAGPGPFADIVLCGHTHGGQIRVPGLGAVYTSSAYGRYFDHGWYSRRQDGALMYITAGVGVTGRGPLRRRIRCAPELVVLELCSSSTAAFPERS